MEIGKELELEGKIIDLRLKISGLEAKIRHLESGEKQCDYCLEWWEDHLVHVSGICCECMTQKNGERIQRTPAEIAKEMFDVNAKDDLLF